MNQRVGLTSIACGPPILAECLRSLVSEITTPENVVAFVETEYRPFSKSKTYPGLPSRYLADSEDIRFPKKTQVQSQSRINTPEKGKHRASLYDSMFVGTSGRLE